ncbi:MAG TPA: autotransporter outer membrane beta-barrel domain-containing protein [Pseudomonas sp.]|nr:autotransporter outer membrane beta-barrel domain-containing protein [Pseudomonas sp.]
MKQFPFCITRRHAVSALGMAVGMAISSVSLAHTTSIGYTPAGAGSMIFWFGTYHGSNFNEGEVKLVGQGGLSYSSIQQFSLLSNVLPTGLVLGDNYFGSDGTQLVGTQDGGSSAWQGATFSGLQAGTYAFTYIPLGDPESYDPGGTPTADWAPIDSIISGGPSNTITISAALLGGGGYQTTLLGNIPGSYASGLAAHLDTLGGMPPAGLTDTFIALNALSPEEQSVAMARMAPITSTAISGTASRAVSSILDSISVRLNSAREERGFAPNLANLDYRSEVLLADTSSAYVDPAQLAGSGRYGFWMKAFGSTGNQNMRDGYSGYDASTSGLSLGADTRLKSDWVVGGAFTYAKTNVDLNDLRNGDNSDLDTYQLTGYASRDFGTWYLDAMLAYARQQFETQRYTGLGAVAKGDFDGDQWGSKVEAGYPIALTEQLSLTPLAGLEWTRLELDSYTEKDAGALSLQVDEQNGDTSNSLLGARLEMDIPMTNQYRLKPSVHAMWRHQFQNSGLDTTASFLGGGGSFTTPGQDMQRDNYTLGVAVDLQQRDGSSVSLQLDSLRASGLEAYAAQLQANWLF